MDENEFHAAVLAQMGELVKAQNETTRSVASSMAEAVKPLVSVAANIAVLKERTKELHTPLNCPLRVDLSSKALLTVYAPGAGVYSVKLGQAQTI